MGKIALLLLLAVPLWIAAKLDAPKWLMVLSAVPFFAYAASLGDPDEDLLGEGFKRFRAPLLVLLGVAGLVLGVGFYVLWRAMSAP